MSPALASCLSRTPDPYSNLTNDSIQRLKTSAQVIVTENPMPLIFNHRDEADILTSIEKRFLWNMTMIEQYLSPSIQ